LVSLADRLTSVCEAIAILISPVNIIYLLLRGISAP